MPPASISESTVSSLFAFNAALIVSDGLEARIGTLTAGWEWFKRWHDHGREVPTQWAVARSGANLHGRTGRAGSGHDASMRIIASCCRPGTAGTAGRGTLPVVSAYMILHV